MKDDLKERLAGFYRSEVESIRVPAPPVLRSSSFVFRGGERGKRKRGSDIAGMVGAAAAAALCFAVPLDRADTPVSRGAERLISSAEVRSSLSEAFFKAARMLGESIAKE